MAQDRAVVYTVGHSNHPIERFVELLRDAGSTAVADVRSIPHSRRHPQFGRARLERSLREANIAYVYLGVELGGRPADPTLLCDGKPDYARMAATPAFSAGLDRIVDGAQQHRIAIMCAEREPLDCHRFLLVSPHLLERGVGVRHILADGRIEPHDVTQARGRSGSRS